MKQVNFYKPLIIKKMSKISSNNYQQAVKEITAMDADQVSRIPETINEADKNHYHVALVRIQDRPGQPKNDVNVNVQQYHPRGFEKISKNYVFQGFAKLVVVHNPTKPSEPVQETPPANTTAKTGDANTNPPAGDQNDGKTPENDSKGSEDGKADDVKKPDPINGDDAKKEQLEKEYQFAIGGNKPELLAFAEKNGIDLTDATNNELRQARITAWFNDVMETSSND